MLQNFPKILQEKIQIIYSPEEIETIKSGFSQEKRPTTFRVNILKSSNQEIEQVLWEHQIQFEKIPYLSNGYKVINAKEKDLWNLPIFTEGKIYLQWITSQLIGEIIAKDIQKKDLKILDLTAAPWGKTSHISALLENKWEIFANELQSIRREKLKFTIERQWCENVEIIAWDAKDLKNKFEKEFFDIIIADVPCSAEGRVQLHKEKSYAFLEKPWIHKKNYALQKNILCENIDLLKKWGFLVYSTCTLEPLENEWILHFLVSNYKDLEIQNIDEYFQQTNIQTITKKWLKSYKNYIFNKQIEKSIRILPSIDTEWFFIAKLKKIW